MLSQHIIVMRGGLVLVLVVLLSVSVFAAPTAPPFEMDGLSDSNDDSSSDPSENTQDSQTISSSDPTNFPPEPNLQSSSLESSESLYSAQLTNSSSDTWIIGIFVLLFLNFILLLIIVLSSSIHILKGKHPFLAFKYSKDSSPPEYQNTPDAIQYTETFQKLEGYMKQYMNSYSYDQIKTVLLREGFTEEEIEAVYLEVRKHAN